MFCRVLYQKEKVGRKHCDFAKYKQRVDRRMGNSTEYRHVRVRRMVRERQGAGPLMRQVRVEAAHSKRTRRRTRSAQSLAGSAAKWIARRALSRVFPFRITLFSRCAQCRVQAFFMIDFDCSVQHCLFRAKKAQHETRIEAKVVDSDHVTEDALV